MNDLTKRWVEALRSGEYKQAQGLLGRNFDDVDSHRPTTFCCLGVLCDLVDPNRWHTGGFKADDNLTINYKVPPKDVWKRIDQDIVMDTLIRLNDGGATFNAIADFIEDSCSNV